MSASFANATPAPAWRSSVGDPDGPVLRRELLSGDVARVARTLLGARLVSTLGGVRVEVVIVETEAYRGPEDPASHAATRTGPTARNAAMFGPPGHAYVYLIYGMHWCLNVVTGPEGEASAVLVRGAEPLSGRDVMEARRQRRRPLLAGPGRLCQGLGVDGDLYGHVLDRPPLLLARGWNVDQELVGVSGRIGVVAAAEEPLRFYVRGSPGVTPGTPRV